MLRGALVTRGRLFVPRARRGRPEAAPGRYTGTGGPVNASGSACAGPGAGSRTRAVPNADFRATHAAALAAGALSSGARVKHSPDMAEFGPEAEGFLRTALAAAHSCHDFLAWMDEAGERLAPETLPDLSARAASEHAPALRTARLALGAARAPGELDAWAGRFVAAVDEAGRSCDAICEVASAPPFARIELVLASLHHAARAQEGFYALRGTLAPFAGFWNLPGAKVRDLPPRRADAKGPATGLVHVGAGSHHGGFSLYVPEDGPADRVRPVVVALHGGSGNGRDFLWTWLREARSRDLLLVAPTAVEQTWGPREDEGLLSILGWIANRWPVDRRRILLTGLSDGATFSLVYGLAHPGVYRAIAPLCGVLHPANEAIGNLGRARGVPVYLVHGARDFLFPVEIARAAHETLREAGADVTYREIAELSHAYPRSENVRILDWFESLPA